VAEPDNWPVLVHCHGGGKRAGVMAALVRFAFDGGDDPRIIKSVIQRMHRDRAEAHNGPGKRAQRQQGGSVPAAACVFFSTAMKARPSVAGRLAAAVLSLAVLAAGVAPGYAWQCLDGTPCPAECPKILRAAAPGSSLPACEACQQSTAPSHPADRSLGAGSCVLRATDGPACVLEKRAGPPTDAQPATIPPAARVAGPVASNRFASREISPPPRIACACAHSGRAPPSQHG